MNETFWFFYWVDIIGSIPSVLTVYTGVCALIALIVGLHYTDCYGDDEKLAKARIEKYAPRLVYLWLFLAILAFVAPTKTAMYAGAGQYVAESTELDDTLYQLKDLIDEKIADLKAETKK